MNGAPRIQSGDPIHQFEAFERQLTRHADRPTLRTVNASDWLDTEPAKSDPILGDTFDRGDKVAVIGLSKLRKSFLVLQLAMHVAAGMDFLAWKVGKPRRVLLVQMEVKEAHFHRRVKRMAENISISRDDLRENLLIVNGRGQEVTLEDIGILADEFRPDLIIFDPLYKLVTGDENSAQDMKPILAEFDRLAERSGAAVLYVHHDPKGQAGDRNIRDRGAGSSVIGRDYDCCITMTAHRDDPQAVVIETLLRNYKSQDSFAIGWCEGNFRTASLPAVPARSGRGTNPASAKPADEYVDQAVALVPKPVSMSEFADELITKLGLTQKKARAVQDAVLRSGRLKRTKQRYERGGAIYIGTAEAIDELEPRLREQHLPGIEGKEEGDG
jgi:hypothetical protein